MLAGIGFVCRKCSAKCRAEQRTSGDVKCKPERDAKWLILRRQASGSALVTRWRDSASVAPRHQASLPTYSARSRRFLDFFIAVFLLLNSH